MKPNLWVHHEELGLRVLDLAPDRMLEIWGTKSGHIHSGKRTWQWKMDLSNIYSLLKMVNFHFHVSLPECNQLRICKIMRTVTKTVVRSTGKQDVPLHGDATYGVLELQSFVGIHEAKNSAKSPKAIFKIISNFLLQTLKTCLFFFEPRVIKVTILQTVWRWWSFSMLTALVQVLMPGLRLGLTNSPWAKPYKFMRSRCWETHWLTFVMCLDKDECYDSDPYGIKFSLLDQVGRLVSSGNYEGKNSY